MKSIVFRVSGDYARFRKSYTTTSALTYLVMHPIAIRGMIGAILGIDKKELYEKTKDIDVGIQVLNPIKKDMQSFNLINMKVGKKKDEDATFRFPSNVEFLRDVEYRIFVKCKDDTLNQIKDVLINREFIFTPYLGASEHIAKVEYENEYEVLLLDKNYYNVNSVVDQNTCNIDFSYDDITIYTDNIPVKNSITREYTEYKKIIFSINQPLRVDGEGIYKVGEYNVMFL